MLADRDGYEAAGAALGGCLAFLKDAMLDKQVGARCDYVIACHKAP